MDQFFAEAAGLLRLVGEGRGRRRPSCRSATRPAAAAAVYKAVRAKVDDYFARCRLAAFDPRALAALNRPGGGLPRPRRQGPVDHAADEIAGFPLAPIEPGKPLPLTQGVNPAWAGAAGDASARRSSQPLLGRTRRRSPRPTGRRSAAKLARLRGLGGRQGRGRRREAGHRARARDPRRARRKDAIDRARSRRTRRSSRAATRSPRSSSWCATTATSTGCSNNFVDLPRLLRAQGQGDLPGRHALPRRRSCDLCVRVDDAGKHAAPGRRWPKTYLAYCDCTRRRSGEKMTDRRGLHRRRLRQPDGRPQRRLLRPQGPRLGRHDHQDRRQPDQHPPGVLGAVQAARPHDRGAGGQARGGGRRRVEREARRRRRPPRRPRTKAKAPAGAAQEDRHRRAWPPSAWRSAAIGTAIGVLAPGFFGLAWDAARHRRPAAR